MIKFNSFLPNLIIFLLYLFVFQSIAQKDTLKITVLQVSGNVTYGEDHKPLKLDQQLDASTVLYFSDPLDHVALWSNNKKYYVFGENKNEVTRSKDKNWWEILLDWIETDKIPKTVRSGDNSPNYLVFDGDIPVYERNISVNSTLKGYFNLDFNEVSGLKNIKIKPDSEGSMALTNHVMQSDVQPTHVEVSFHQRGASEKNDSILYFIKQKKEVQDELSIMKQVYSEMGLSNMKIMEKLQFYIYETYDGRTDLNAFEPF